MTWKTYWTVIGIVYPTYYAINIAYDLYVYHKKNKRQTSSTYDVSGIFGNEIKPVVVNFDSVEFENLNQNALVQNYNPQQEVESQNMTVDEFLVEVNRTNSNIVSSIFS